MSTVRMADGTTEHRCAECGAPVTERQVIGGCLCDPCLEAIIDANWIELVEDDAAPACDHCGRPCDPQAEGTTVYCSVQCYASATATHEAETWDCVSGIRSDVNGGL